ncbi:MAG: TIGR04282 family arsenosugar biosynthesis glycosyltransferase [Deltaproteobacteria bacterium]|nr:TIGR04282 family arsenosugar biosynthesis glycosyltransferase [Deltaproteobacteria bacterium]
MKANAIAVMMKAPLLGEVKTRLSPPLTPKQALSVYVASAKTTLSTLRKMTDHDVHLFIYPPEEIGLAIPLIPKSSPRLQCDSRISSSFQIHPQTGAAFTERLTHSIALLFNQGYEKILQIGTDSPQLSPVILQKATLALDGVDIIIGPALDGGFYLLGMKKPHLALYEGLPLSTPHTCNALMRKIESLNLSFSLLQGLRDIDTFEDLRSILRFDPLLLRGYKFPMRNF